MAKDSKAIITKGRDKTWVKNVYSTQLSSISSISSINYKGNRESDLWGKAAGYEPYGEKQKQGQAKEINKKSYLMKSWPKRCIF